VQLGSWVRARDGSFTAEQMTSFQLCLDSIIYVSVTLKPLPPYGRAPYEHATLVGCCRLLMGAIPGLQQHVNFHSFSTYYGFATNACYAQQHEPSSPFLLYHLLELQVPAKPQTTYRTSERLNLQQACFQSSQLQSSKVEARTPVRLATTAEGSFLYHLCLNYFFLQVSNHVSY